MLHGERVGLLWLREEDRVVVPAMNCCKMFTLFACRKKLRKWIATAVLHVRLALIIPDLCPSRPPVSFVFLRPYGFYHRPFYHHRDWCSVQSPRGDAGQV